VPRDRHRHCLGDAGANQVSRRRAAEVVEKPAVVAALRVADAETRGDARGLPRLSGERIGVVLGLWGYRGAGQHYRHVTATRRCIEIGLGMIQESLPNSRR